MQRISKKRLSQGVLIVAIFASSCQTQTPKLKKETSSPSPNPQSLSKINLPKVSESDWKPFFQPAQITSAQAPSTPSTLTDQDLENLFYQGNTTQLKSYLEDKLKQDPNDIETVLALALVKIQENQTDDCLNLLQTAEHILENSPSKNHSIRVKYLKSRAFFEAGLWIEALRLAKSMIYENKYFVQGYNLVAAILVYQGFTRQAEFVLDRAMDLERDASQPELINMRGVVAYLKEEHLNALELFETALKTDPDFLPAKLNLANAYLSLGDYPKAKITYSQILEQNSNQAGAWLGLAVIDQQLGKKDSVKHYLMEALRSSPHLAAARLNKSLFILEQGEPLIHALSYLNQAQHTKNATPRVRATASLLAEILKKPTTHLPPIDHLLY